MRKIGTLVAVVVMAVLPAAAHPTGSHIEGTVSGEDTGQGVGSVCVEAMGADYNWGWAETADDGTYSMDVEPDTYVISFTDCASPARYLREYYDDAGSYDDATPVTVGVAETVPGVDATLAVGGRITGTITDQQTGEPLAWVCATAYDENYNWLGSGSSDEDGRYVIGGLPSGDLRVEFAGSCYYLPFVRPVRPPLVQASPASSPPPPNAGDGYIGEWWNDQEDFDSADPVAVVQGAESAGIDAALELGGTISGSVTDERGRPIPGVCVSAHDAVNGSYARGSYQGDDQPGGYEIRGLRTGAYKVEFQDCWDGNFLAEWYDDKPTFRTADEVAVVAGESTTGIDAVLARRPRPDIALARIDVEPVPLTTDVITVGSVGTQRTVTVTAQNRGDADADGVFVTLYAQGRTDGRWTFVGDRWLGRVAAGARKDSSFRWDANGAIGDTRLYAEVCSYDDADHSNNRAEADHYVIVGGTGFGLSPARGGGDYPVGCFWESVA